MKTYQNFEKYFDFYYKKELDKKKITIEDVIQETFSILKANKLPIGEESFFYENHFDLLCDIAEEMIKGQ